MRNFIAISTETVQGKLCYVGTSTERFLYVRGEDISTKQAIDFLFSLHALARRKENRNAIFVWYSSLFDVELLLRDLPDELKDVIFPSPETNRRKSILRKLYDYTRRAIRSCADAHKRIAEKGLSERESIVLSVFDANACLQPFEWYTDVAQLEHVYNIALHAEATIEVKDKATALRFLDAQMIEQERFVKEIRKELHRLEFVYWNGYRMRIRQGKSFTVSKLKAGGRNCKSITIYDLVNFFDKKPLLEVSAKYLGYTLPDLTRKPPEKLELFQEIQRANELEEVAKHVRAECETIAALAAKVDEYTQGAGIKLTRWYGASSAVNTLLRKWNAHKEFSQIREDNTPRVLYHAIESALYGGRIETVKLGTLHDIYVYDLNSAFAWAATQLAKLNKVWRFTNQYTNDYFSLWFVEYDLPEAAYLGIAPHRERDNISYRKQGRGWYYAPEVAVLLNKCPSSVRIKYGYTLPYTKIDFAAQIEGIYNHRLDLIAREGKGKGEEIFKSMLHCFYGKFAQTTGQAMFHCKPWAGFITSLVRAKIVEAIGEQARDVICMHTDSIHSLKPLKNATVGNGLGEWDCKYYDKGLYIQSGIYQLYGAGGKAATRGFEYIDFERAIEQLNEKGAFEATREYYVGYRLANEFPLDRGKDYLKLLKETQWIEPQLMRPRVFERKRFDWSSEWIDSQIITVDSRRESGRQRERDVTRRLHMMLDAVTAKRHERGT